jgi:hypothetical protein
MISQKLINTFDSMDEDKRELIKRMVMLQVPKKWIGIISELTTYQVEKFIDYYGLRGYCKPPEQCRHRMGNGISCRDGIL